MTVFLMTRPAEIMPGIILEYLAYLGIRELCGNNRGYTRIIAHAYCARRVRTSLGIAAAWSRLVDDSIEGECTSSC